MDCLSLETIETWIVSVCHSEDEWTRQNNGTVFERGMVVGARRTGFESRTATLLGFSLSTVSI